MDGIGGVGLPTVAGIAAGLALPGSARDPLTTIYLLERIQAAQLGQEERRTRLEQEERQRRGVPLLFRAITGDPTVWKDIETAGQRGEIDPSAVGPLATLQAEQRRTGLVAEHREAGIGQRRQIAGFLNAALADPRQVSPAVKALTTMDIVPEAEKAKQDALTTLIPIQRRVAGLLQRATAAAPRQEVGPGLLEPWTQALEPPPPGAVQPMIAPGVRQFLQSAGFQGAPATPEERRFEATQLGETPPETPSTPTAPTALQDAVARGIAGVPLSILAKRTESPDPQVATVARGQLRLVTSELQGTRNDADRITLEFYGPSGSKRAHPDVFSFDDLARMDPTASKAVRDEVQQLAVERAREQARAQATVQLEFEKQKPLPLDEVAIDLTAARKNPAAPVKRVTLLTMGEARERTNKGEIAIVDPTLFRQVRGLDAATPVLDEIGRILPGLPETGGLGPLINRVMAPARRLFGFAAITTEIDAAQGFNLFMGRIMQGAAAQLSNRDVEMAQFLNVSTGDSQETLRVKLDIARRLMPRFKLALLGVDLSETSTFTGAEAAQARRTLLRDVIRQELSR